MREKFLNKEENRWGSARLTCVDDDDVDVLRVAGRRVTLVLPTVHLAGVTDDQTGGRLVSSVWQIKKNSWNFPFNAIRKGSFFKEIISKLMRLYSWPEL